MSERIGQSRTKKSASKAVPSQKVSSGKKVNIQGSKVIARAKVAGRTRVFSDYPERNYKVLISAKKATALYLGQDRKSFAREDGDLVEVGPINKKLYQVFVNRVGLSQKEQLVIFHLAPATLSRRLKGNVDFTKLESDLFYRVAEVYRNAAEVFGSEDVSKRWMDEVSGVLGNKRPKDLLGSSAGVDLVKDELLRIAYGVYS